MDWWDCGAGRMRMGGELVEPSVAHVEGAADYRRTSTGEGRGGGGLAERAVAQEESCAVSWSESRQ